MAMMGVPTWMLSVPLTSFQLLAAGGALLICAGVLLAFRRKTRVTLERSPLTDELMIYLGRIADALERQKGLSTDEVKAALMEKMEETANAKPNGKVKEMPFSIFGREVRTDE